VLKNALLAVDIEIANLKERIKTGTANNQIVLLQLAELLENRKAILKQLTTENQPTKDLPPGEKSEE